MSVVYKYKRAYKMRIIDWSSVVWSYDHGVSGMAALAAAPPDLKHRAQALADEAQAARESEAAAVAALREGEQGAQVADRKLADANEALSVAREARAGAAARAEALEARRQEMNRSAGRSDGRRVGKEGGREWRS